MTAPGRKALTRLLLIPSALTLVGLAAPAFAQDAPAAPAQSGSAPAAAPRRPVDGRQILQLLVRKGVITQAEADALEAQASGTAAPAAPRIPAGGVSGNTQTIPYIPEPVRNRIESELRTQVKQEAAEEGWANPHLIPGWLGKVALEADLRVRDQADLFDKSNDPNIVNFDAINTGAPFDLNHAADGGANAPFLNTTYNRNMQRVRARLGIIARPDDWVSFEIRLATGNDDSPVSPNQTLGAEGDFSKYAAWFDRFDLMLTPHGVLNGLRFDLGRGQNPFWTTALEFYPDLSFDGFSARYRHTIGSEVEAFGTAGAFPIFNTALNFSSNDVGAFRSRNEYLYASQLGLAYEPASGVTLTGAAGFFYYDKVQGELSAPCLWNQDVCSTDDSRMPFEQWGNSIIPIRNIVQNPSVAPGLSPIPEYFGLASPFHVLEAHLALDFGHPETLPVRIESEFLDNLAFNRASVLANQVNVTSGSYDPGHIGWLAQLTVGKPVIEKLGDWNFQVGYRYLESDATVDAIADADFHLGGTNAKGYTLTGYYGIAKNTSIGVRWLAADVITGPRYSNDVLQVDLNTAL